MIIFFLGYPLYEIVQYHNMTIAAYVRRIIDEVIMYSDLPTFVYPIGHIQHIIYKNVLFIISNYQQELSLLHATATEILKI